VALQKLSAAELAKTEGKAPPSSRQRALNPYADFFKGIRVGQGGHVMVAEEGVSRQYLKLKISAAAKDAGVTIKYLSTGPDEVRFKVTGRGKRRQTGS
jgi:hypothetical protein